MTDKAVLPVGKIVGTHGIKGYLKLFSSAEPVELLAPGQNLFLSRQGGGTAVFRIGSLRAHKRVTLVALEGIGSMEEAKEWVGCQVCMDKASLPQLEENTYYWYQLVGMEVFAVGERRLGRLEAIIPTGSNDVYVVQDGEQELLIPAIDSVVVDIDLEGNRMRVDLPEGLEG